MSASAFFVTGGALQVDAGSYVARAADGELLDGLRAGEFCYVLTSRQMGKSSLMVRTAAQLRNEGSAVVILDLTAIGQNLDVEQWYFSMLGHVGTRLGIEEEMEAYWDENIRRAPLQRFMGAIRDVYLSHKRKPLVIFVDEIDAVRSLRQFSADEFFAGIRECYNRRPEDPKLERLTYCLLGVATPSDLIRDDRITPFNIGRAIELGDFTATDAAVLAGGLSPHRDTARELLARVLWWTSGQPYLTQKLCAEVVKDGANSAREVDEACARIFLSVEARERDDNLHFVRDRLLRSEHDRAALLDGYAKVCRGEKLADDHLNPLINELRLSGVVRVAGGLLQPRNRIYSRVFDRSWVRENLPDAEARRQRAAFYRGVRRVAGTAVVVLAIMGLLANKARLSADAVKAASERARLAAQESEAASQRAKHAADEREKAASEAQAAAKREAAANEERLREADRTKDMLNRLVETQTKVAGLLEALMPLAGDKRSEQILARAEDIVRSVPGSAADDPRLTSGLAGLRRVCGRLYLRLGNQSAAIAQADEARKLVEDQLKRAAGDPGLHKHLHDCLVLLGDAALGGRTTKAEGEISDADYQRALTAYREATKLAKAMCGAHPTDATWRTVYFDDLNNLGDAAKLVRKDREAEDRYREALQTIAEDRRRLPAATDFDGIEASVHDRLGTLFLDRNDMDNARHEFDRALQLRQLDPAEIQTNDLERKAGLALSYNKMGNFFLRQDQPREALDYYLKSVTLRRELCDGAERTDWKRNLGFSLANAADRYWELKEYAPSIDLTRERYDLAEALHQADPNDPELTTDYQNALKALASRLMQAPDRALQDVDRALELARSGVEYTQRRSSQMLLLLAEALRMSKRTAEAAEIAAEARRLPPAVSLSAEEAGSGRERGAGERKNKAPEPAGGKKATRKRKGG